MAQVTTFPWHKAIGVQVNGRKSAKCQILQLTCAAHSNMQLLLVVGVRLVLHSNLLALLRMVDVGVSCLFCHVDNEDFYYKTIH